MISAASHPQQAMIARSQADPHTQAILKETLQTPSAVAYFEQQASPEAKRTLRFSQRELEWFEVGRRYANTDYLTDLQSMEGDNLIREAIRIQNLQNWLLLGIKQQLQESHVLARSREPERFDATLAAITVSHCQISLVRRFYYSNHIPGGHHHDAVIQCHYFAFHHMDQGQSIFVD